VGKTAGPKKKKNQDPVNDGRIYPRLKPSSVPFLKGVSFNQGTDVTVIDISREGILIETEVRLRPQMKIHLKLTTTDGVIKLDGSVLRSSVTSLTGAPKYQSAIAFDHPFHMLDDLSEPQEAAASEVPAETSEVPVLPEESHQPLPPPVSGSSDNRSSGLTFASQDVPGTSLLDLFKQNDW
jgi:hypothetical protein